ncbi:BA14K family protein [Pararhizobium arenae]|uniref:BA14K family protein n=1 Tax=Pararhizobium arenae TaxID=1856850 RepID=UPI00094A9EE8|nr:BA14K family protein [Pararhizobium arenae]
MGRLSKLIPAALSAVFLITSVAPSQAFTSIPVPTKAERVSDVQTVQYRRDRDRDRDYRRGYYRNGGRYYYNGHRGYRYSRPGYRQYNGAWFPLAAFATGAIIGGAVAQPRPVYPAPSYSGGGSHAQWCANRYRSYRAYDNTFQPYNGPRQQCYSPYS